MAGDWIKFEHATPDKPEVFRMSVLLNIDPDAVVGKLARFWSWCDQQTVDGNDLGVPDSVIDRVTHQPGFSAALRKVSWLQARSGSLAIPNFDRHNGQTAKARALASRKKADQRDKRNLSPEMSPENGDKTGTREEKRREEKKIDPPIVAPAAPSAPKPRNELFDALARATGVDPFQLTRTGGSAVGVALADIKRVFPDVTPDEIQRRAEAYRKLHPTWDLTAPALAKHWAGCVPGSTTPQPARDYSKI